MIEFKSKRNRVYLREGKVYKHFNSVSAAQAEALFINMLLEKGVKVPAVLGHDGDVLIIEYIDGLTLPDLLCSQDEPDWRQISAALTGWLQSFYDAVCHETTGEIRGDVNGRNFIFHAGDVWGVDFEEHCYGVRETDAGRLLAYITTYEIPDTTRKIVLSNALERQFTDVMKLDPIMITAEREKELHAMTQRRKR